MKLFWIKIDLTSYATFWVPCKDKKKPPQIVNILSTLAMRQLFHIFLSWSTFHLVKSNVYQMIQVCTRVRANVNILSISWVKTFV